MTEIVSVGTVKTHTQAAADNDVIVVDDVKGSGRGFGPGTGGDDTAAVYMEVAGLGQGFRLGEDSSAYKVGFEQIPFKRIGISQDRYRAQVLPQ